MAQSGLKTNIICYGDNLQILREHIPGVTGIGKAKEPAASTIPSNLA